MQSLGFNCIEEGDLAMATLIHAYKHTPFVSQDDFFFSTTPLLFNKSLMLKAFYTDALTLFSLNAMLVLLYSKMWRNVFGEIWFES